ncbi:unnamed protein product [Owenia fusiformis]|uniref:Proteasome activator complex subunit 4 C-terminal domain-containing protein n=1 Tax=Owenia fusiformis TaxID=6347 RepID=A0A8S4PEQ2_OWEFU|nr:unnamed protein product [Owenia fusiformis]
MTTTRSGDTANVKEQGLEVTITANGDRRTIIIVQKEAVGVTQTKRALKWISGSMGRMLYTLPPDMLKFLPLICIYVQDTTDDELKAECQTALHLMAHTLQRTENVQHVLHVIKEISGLGIWRARTAVLTFIQAFVFYNLFTVLQTEHLDQIKDVVLHLLVDDQLEVREAAAVTLGGFLHCGYLKIDKQMLTHFEKLSSTKVKKQKRQQQVPISIESLIKRHAGILGLSALVQAYPYDVPEFMPQVLMDLSNHLDDPQPIQMTVKKTLSDFRRTHHDNWQDHKQKFTDDQLKGSLIGAGMAEKWYQHATLPVEHHVTWNRGLWGSISSGLYY